MQWIDSASGVTISGGEPFDQPEALVELVQRLKGMFQGDLLIFTGHSYERIAPQLGLLSGLVDAVITDPFRQGEAHTKALRGSDNQRLHLLTPLGRERLGCYERPRTRTDDALDVMFDPEGSVWIAGIPRRDDMLRLRAEIVAAGGQAAITQARHK
jgi:anaerobic ribonucleoside-triphosphate reductase activating protein